MLKRVLLLSAVVAVMLLAALLWQVPWWASLSGAFLLTLAVVSLVNPFFGLSVSVFTLIISTANLFYLVVNTLQIHLYFYYIPLLCSCAGILTQAAVHKRKLYVRSYFMQVLLLVFVAEVVALVWVPHFLWGAANILRLILNIVLYYCIMLLVDTERKVDILLKTIMASALMTSIGVVASLYYDYDIHKYLTSKLALELFFYTTRAGGIESWNQSAGLLNVASILAAAYAVLARSRVRRFFWAGAALYFFCMMLLPASRGALLGFLGAITIFLLIHPLTRPFFLKKTAIFIAILVLGILITSPEYIDRLLVGFGYTGELLFSKKKSSTSSDSDATGLSTRFKIWGKGFRTMGDRPGTLLVGLGPGGFTYHAKVFEVHNVYLAFFFDVGLFGVFILAFFVFIFLSRGMPVFQFYEARLIRPPPGVKSATKDFPTVMFFGTLTALLAEVGIHGLVDYDLTSLVSRYVYLYLAVYDVVLRLAEAQREAAGRGSAPDPCQGAALDPPGG